MSQEFSDNERHQLVTREKERLLAMSRRGTLGNLSNGTTKSGTENETNPIQSTMCNMKTAVSEAETSVGVAMVTRATLRSDCFAAKQHIARLRKDAISLKNKRKQLQDVVSEVRMASNKAFSLSQGEFVWDATLHKALKSRSLKKEHFDSILDQLKLAAASGITPRHHKQTHQRKDEGSFQEWITDAIASLKQPISDPQDFIVGGRYFRPSIAINGDYLVSSTRQMATSGSISAASPAVSIVSSVAGSVHEPVSMSYPPTPSRNLRHSERTSPSTRSNETFPSDIHRAASLPSNAPRILSSHGATAFESNKAMALQTAAILSAARVASLQDELESIKQLQQQRESKYIRLLDMCMSGHKVGPLFSTTSNPHDEEQ